MSDDEIMNIWEEGNDMTTKAEISGWFDRGAMDGKQYMLVVFDTFDNEDYPVYAATAADCLAEYKAPGEMQRVVEVYSLTSDKAAQLRETRAMHLPDASATADRP